jgi:antitoxin MazE
MTEVVLDLKTWGNSLGVRLPAAIARAAKLHKDQKVRLSVVKGQVIIVPVLNEYPTLEQMLETFDPEDNEGEVMQTSQRLGAEQW